MEFDPKVVQSAAEMIVSTITESEKRELVKRAIAKLTEKKGWGGDSDLQLIVNEQVEAMVANLVCEAMTADEAFKGRIRFLYSKAAEVAFSQKVEMGLINRMARNMGDALTGDD